MQCKFNFNYFKYRNLIQFILFQIQKFDSIYHSIYLFCFGKSIFCAIESRIIGILIGCTTGYNLSFAAHLAFIAASTKSCHLLWLKQTPSNNVSDVIAHPGIIKVNTTRSAHIFIAEMLCSTLVAHKRNFFLRFCNFAALQSYWIITFEIVDQKLQHICFISECNM